ncbi:unnamed protein product [Ectocarpus sp. 8 AP-2014]
MLTRKQQWMRIRVRRRDPGNPGGNTSSKKHRGQPQQQQQHDACGGVDQEEEDGGSSTSTSSSGTMSTFSSFDSLEAVDVDDSSSFSSSSSSSSPLPLPSQDAVDRPRTPRIKGVSFQQEVEVFLVTHNSELDLRAKQALWWTGRDAAMNKRAWLHHLGQPGCGRESVDRQPRPYQPKRHRSSPSHFVGGGRHTAADRGLGGRSWPSHSSASGMLSAGTAETAGAEASRAAAAAEEQSLFLPTAVGILGCRCQACLTEGEHEHEHEQQQPPSPPPPTYEPPSQAPPPYDHRQPPPRYDAVAAAAAAAAAAAGGGHVTARAAGRTWDDGEREEGDLGMKGSRSYSPASAQGSSPLLEACESYDDDEGVFPTGSYFFYD